jgi:hypothetical protein
MKRPPVTRLIALSVALAAAACGGKQPAPEPPEPDPVTSDPTLLAQSIVDALGEMTIAAEGHAGDCPAMAAALSEVFERVRPTFDRVAELRREPETARELTAAFRPYDVDAARLGERMSTALQPCAKDTSVVDAMAKMPVIQ